MEQATLQQDGDLDLQDGLWKSGWTARGTNADGVRETPAPSMPGSCEMTIAEFVQHLFVPEHVAMKGYRGGHITRRF